ncbi:hypothetical protein EBZ80_21470 [bacterium]|nr:hypothetical protein [bacterium]
MSRPSEKFPVCACLALSILSFFIAFSTFAQPLRSAQPKAHAFNQRTWVGLQRELGPQLVVFSSTDCIHCPALIEALAKNPHVVADRIQLSVIVMDGDQHSGRAHPYNLAKRVYFFHGNEAAIRFAVNPGWRGETPQVALIQSSGRVKFVLGMPSNQDIDSLLK